MSRTAAAVGLVGASWAALGGGATARAAEDGAYGRLDGDLALGIEAGVAAAFPGEALVLRPSAQYLCSAGLFGQYGESFGGAGQPVARSLAAGVELRPLFLARLLSDLEQGPILLDLFVDSLSLEVAVFGAAPGTDAGRWITGIGIGTGLELPLVAHASGPFVALRTSLRFAIGGSDHDGSGGDGSGGDGSVGDGALMLTLGYRQMLDATLVSPDGDE